MKPQRPSPESSRREKGTQKATSNPNDNDIDAFLLERSFNGRILLIPVNSGYLDFGLNLLCSLRNLTKPRRLAGPP